MSKNKLQRYADLATFNNVIEPDTNENLNTNFVLKGKWHNDFFKNTNPIILELGCGKGEYTVGLAEKNPDVNFIGIDIKGARIWKGAKAAISRNIINAFFLRIQIDFINCFFDVNEISEVWITFPDPQLKKIDKRLTSAQFLNSYLKILRPDGVIHLKTDNNDLYDYTMQLIKKNHLEIISNTNDLYTGDNINDAKMIQTFYEKKFLSENISINYIQFKLNSKHVIEL